MSGLKPEKHILFVVIAGVLAAVGLFSLPKYVVQNEAGEQPAQSSSETTTTEKEPHLQLSEQQDQALAEIKNSSKDPLDIYQDLATFFAGANMYDSSAFYAEKRASEINNEQEWLMTGDYYYQAYSLSLNPVTQEEFAEKARSAYQKALEINPNQLHARTNTAMTYVTSASPMQAIMMLRQVLEINPRYVPAIMSMGALSMQSGQYDRAVSRFKQALAIDEGNLNAQLGLAYSLIETGEKDKAKSILEGLSEIGLDDVLQNEVDKTLESLK
ncbi:tetratricopeptide repeat protein [Jiulongibacter sediminis]|jgi:tetratricopeptide (TPR) repeat protein|uniref:tetratricopeptide repeat protein n=1 Tax=Jiulongibacter sediminis TaxID=1605367 RepID=UPI0026EB3ACD|nr:tetratricopeptide repeat protein [Jiulongibacter sediminis]